MKQLLILLSILSFNIFAQHTLQIKDQSITLTAYLVDLSMDKTDCNQEVFSALKEDALRWKRFKVKEDIIVSEFKRYKIQEKSFCKILKKIKTH